MATVSFPKVMYDRHMRSSCLSWWRRDCCNSWCKACREGVGEQDRGGGEVEVEVVVNTLYKVYIRCTSCIPMHRHESYTALNDCTGSVRKSFHNMGIMNISLT